MKTTIKKSETLMEFLSGHYPDSPRSRIKKLLQSGKVRINDAPVTLNSFGLKPGDVVEIFSSGGQTAATLLPFPVLYEDEEVILVDKPAGYPTSSTDGSLSIQTIVTEALKKLSKGRYRAHVVHRLDKEVSGVLLFAKTRDSMNSLKDNWNLTEKHYYALVEGIPEKSEDIIKSWLIEDKSQKMHSTLNKENAKFSVTQYKVIKQLEKYSLLDVTTETGRKNQIRVHMADIGCPIVGDRKYGASPDFIRRVRLHACSLSFPHPVTGQMVRVISEMPDGFLKLKPKNEHYK